ncbi:MAG: hypothetical protein PF450_15495 [Bacteroidales bacterium]|jgi:hypothetical protein|nr:hypothetical protein [Bacteroidales bacterium]
MKNFTIKSLMPLLLFGLLFIFIISGCSNFEDASECLDGKNYGFLNGLWHGIIAPLDLIAMIWRDDVTVYAPNNNGIWYAFGFLLGSGGWGFFGSRGAKKARKRKAGRD